MFPRRMFLQERMGLKTMMKMAEIKMSVTPVKIRVMRTK